MATGLVRAILRGSFAIFFVHLCSNFLSVDTPRAYNIYYEIFDTHQDIVISISLAFLIFLLVAFVVARFVRYFAYISVGIDKLSEDSEQPIILKPELAVMQRKLNTVKALLSTVKQLSWHWSRSPTESFLGTG